MLISARRIGRKISICLGLLLGGLSFAAAAPFSIHGPGVKSNDFRITTFASGLYYPLGMARLRDGSVLVAVSEGARYWSSVGKLIRLGDGDGDVLDDGHGPVPYSG